MVLQCWADDGNLQAWLFLVQFWFPPLQHLLKSFCAWLEWQKFIEEELGFFCVVVYIFICRIMVQRLDWGFGFSPCISVYEDDSYLDQKRSFGSPLTLIQYWQCNK